MNLKPQKNRSKSEERAGKENPEDREGPTGRRVNVVRAGDQEGLVCPLGFLSWWVLLISKVSLFRIEQGGSKFCSVP